MCNKQELWAYSVLRRQFSVIAPLLFIHHRTSNGIFVSYLVGTRLGQDCTFSLLTCNIARKGCLLLHDGAFVTTVQEFLMFPWRLGHPCVVVFGASLQTSVSRFCIFSYWCIRACPYPFATVVRKTVRRPGAVMDSLNLSSLWIKSQTRNVHWRRFAATDDVQRQHFTRPCPQAEFAYRSENELMGTVTGCLRKRAIHYLEN